jgi:hypothetical protein
MNYLQIHLLNSWSVPDARTLVSGHPARGLRRRAGEIIRVRVELGDSVTQ